MARIDRIRLVNSVRLLVPISILAILVLGPAFQLAYGSICTISIGPITFTCPLGFMQIALASQSAVLGLLIPVAATLAATILLGRVFCGWICPAGNVTQRLGNVSIRPRTLSQRLTSFAQQNSTRVVLLGSVLVASALLRYPVFCVVCPIGIICRNIISLSQYGSLGLDILFVPMIVALEFGLAPWCAHICPLGTTLSLLSRKSPVAPMIDKVKCTGCSVCTKVCSMRVSLFQKPKLGDCSKCLDCSFRCPAKAIRWKRTA